MGGLEYGGKKHLGTCIHHAAFQHCRLVVWGVFSWHTLGPLIKVEQRSNATGYLKIIANHVYPFKAAVYPSANAFFSRIMPHATRLGLSRNGSTNMTVNSAYCSSLPSHQISIQLSICGRRWNKLLGEEIHYHPTWHNCGKHWSQHGPASLQTPRTNE